MKKMFITKIVIFIISIMIGILFIHSESAKAAEPQQSYTTIHYTADDSFMVFIPESINVGDEVQISASEINIANGKCVIVSLGILDTDDSVYLHNDSDYSSTVEISFKNSMGDTIYSYSPRIGSFSAGDITPITFSTFIKSNANVKAGDYSGQVTFDIFCE